MFFNTLLDSVSIFPELFIFEINSKVYFVKMDDKVSNVLGDKKSSNIIKVKKIELNKKIVLKFYLYFLLIMLLTLEVKMMHLANQFDL
ncbi:Uncharacterised protein [Providencia alcalifaciens]|nr:Uncharacterised protein [Providencia alcalifaciens]